MSEIHVWKQWLLGQALRLSGSHRHDERGDIVQTVILVALFAAAAIAIAAIIIVKFTDKARTIPTD